MVRNAVVSLGNPDLWKRSIAAIVRQQHRGNACGIGLKGER